MSIRQRIALLLVLMFVAIALIGGYAVRQFRVSAGEVKVVTEGVVPSALASADLVSQLKEVQLATMVLVSAPDDAIAAQSKEKLTEKKRLLQIAIDAQTAGAHSAAQKGLLAQAKESAENYFAAIDDTAAFKAAGKNEMAEASLFGNVVQYQSELEVIVETLRIEKTRDKDRAIAALNENLATTTTAISVLTIVATLVLTAVGVLLYRQITGPISRMETMMTEIASSQDFARRLPVDRLDEVGRSIVAFNGMLGKIQESSSQLAQKSADMHAMLQNMAQGILTVEAGMQVHPEYAAYLETIFETSDIAGRDLMELVFANTNLGADAVAQVAAASSACIGEDLMNFEFNSHLMVSEITKTMPDGRAKILDLDWSPITDDNGTTVRLMLCVRDVTELRALAAEAGEQKRRLEIIGEILAVSQEKFQEFIASSIAFIDENASIIRQHAEFDLDAIAKLFRNMHTVKGNARTYGLKHLTNVVHEAEQCYDELRKSTANALWTPTRMLDELAIVRGQVEYYAKINDVSLGRRGAGRRGSVERYLMVDKKHIQETLLSLEAANIASLDDLVAMREGVRRNLRLLGTEKISETLESVFDSMPALARELGKAAPIIVIRDNGLRVRSQASSVLKNVFMHLIRNAMDHGLETPDVRRVKGKQMAGTIQIDMAIEDGMLHIALHDDGRGLALGHIRNMGIEKGLIKAEDRIDDRKIAHLIFHPGFSTVEKLSEVSGRGVGMDAAQDFVKREHGSIDIEFTDTLAGEYFRKFKMIISLPESFAVDGGDAFATTQRDPSVLTASAERVVRHEETDDGAAASYAA